MKAKKIIALVISIGASAMMVMSGIMKIMGPKEVMEGFASMGISDYRIHLALMEIIFVALFLVPKTRRIGLLFMTGYLGGAIATHLTHALPVYSPALILAAFWVGAYLTDCKIFLGEDACKQ